MLQGAGTVLPPTSWLSMVNCRPNHYLGSRSFHQLHCKTISLGSKQCSPSSRHFFRSANWLFGHFSRRPNGRTIERTHVCAAAANFWSVKPTRKKSWPKCTWEEEEDVATDGSPPGDRKLRHLLKQRWFFSDDKVGFFPPLDFDRCYRPMRLDKPV